METNKPSFKLVKIEKALENSKILVNLNNSSLDIEYTEPLEVCYNCKVSYREVTKNGGVLYSKTIYVDGLNSLNAQFNNSSLKNLLRNYQNILENGSEETTKEAFKEPVRGFTVTEGYKPTEEEKPLTEPDSGVKVAVKPTKLNTPEPKDIDAKLEKILKREEEPKPTPPIKEESFVESVFNLFTFGMFKRK